MANFCHFKTKSWPFFDQNWQFWEFLTYNFQTPLWIFLIFGIGIVLMLSLEKIILYMPEKFWYGEILALLRPKFGHNGLFWEFLTYNFQTQLWIFLIFGMKVVLMVFFEKTCGRVINYNFLKVEHKGSFHTKKIWNFIAVFGRYRTKTLLIKFCW